MVSVRPVVWTLAPLPLAAASCAIGDHRQSKQEEQMQIGCSAPTSGPLIEPDSLLRIATEAESARL